jgi:putative tryptophan/tyrosine transport system substrate-binding protein
MAARGPGTATNSGGRLGFLYVGSPEPHSKRVEAFRNGLSRAGYVEGRNVAIEFRWADRDAQLPELAAELVSRGVGAIVTPVSTQAALAAKAATSSIPIIFAVGGDPVALGLVSSLNRPGGNTTGVSILNVELMPKRLGLLRELAPRAKHFAVLVNPDTAFTPAVVKSLQAGAAALGLEVEVFNASTESAIDSALADIAKQPEGAMLIGPDAFLPAGACRSPNLPRATRCRPGM